MIVPLDFGLDRELWRWVPEDVSLHVTRLPVASRRIDIRTAKALADAIVRTVTVTRLTQATEVLRVHDHDDAETV